VRYIKSIIVIFIISLAALTVYSEEEAKEKFPKIGHIKNDGAVVRAGDNINFENLCALPKSDSVNVIGRRYSWLKILLPKQAFLYVNKDYVDLTSNEKGIGVINAANVNLRAGAGTRYSIIGQISKPEQVSIISEDNGWYKIEPPYGTAGWMHSDQKPEQKKAGSKPKKETTNSTVRLDANYPTPKGNLSITTSTKNSR
jgi:N-acetylmuramoyl-L-alanine amidase